MVTEKIEKIQMDFSQGVHAIVEEALAPLKAKIEMMEKQITDLQAEARSLRVEVKKPAVAAAG